MKEKSLRDPACVVELGDTRLLDKSPESTGPPASGSTEDARKRHRLKLLQTLAYCWVFFSVGMTMSILGVTWLDLRRRFKQRAHLGWVTALRGIGYFVGSLVGGPTLDAMDSHVVLFVTQAAQVLCLCLTPLSPNFPYFGVVTVLLGASGGLLDVACNALVLQVWGHHVGSWIQLLHLAFGAGGMITPIIVTPVDNMFKHVRYSYWLLAGLAALVLPALLILRSPQPHHARHEQEAVAQAETAAAGVVAVQGAEEHPPGGRGGTRVTAIISAVGSLLFVYAGIEIAITSLLVSFLMDLQIVGRDDEANYLTSGFWMSITVGRVLFVAVSPFVPLFLILLVNAAGSCVCTAVLLVSTDGAVVWGVILTLGLFMSSCFPAILALPVSEFGIPLTPTLTSVIVVAGNLGEMLVPLLVSHTMHHYANMMFFVYDILALLVLAACILLVLLALHVLSGVPAPACLPACLRNASTHFQHLWCCHGDFRRLRDDARRWK